jgi:hypothetical protein
LYFKKLVGLYSGQTSADDLHRYIPPEESNDHEQKAI